MDGAHGRGSAVPLAADDADAWARASLERLLGLPGVRRVGLALTEGGGRRLRFTASDRDHARAVDWCFIDAYDDVPLTQVVRTGETIAGALDTLDPRYAGLVAHQRQAGTRALAAVALPGTGSPRGGLVLFYDQDQPFDVVQRSDLTRRAAELAAGLLRLGATAPRREPVPAVAAPAGGDARVAETDVKAEPRAVGEARRFLRRALGGWGVADEVVDVAVLCLSELVTNAVIHTATPSQVRAELQDGVLTVAVQDQGSLGRVGPRPPGDVDPLRVHGRGLQLVDALTSRWGSEVDAVGTTVWFVLEPDARADAG